MDPCPAGLRVPFWHPPLLHHPYPPPLLCPRGGAGSSFNSPQPFRLQTTTKLVSTKGTRTTERDLKSYQCSHALYSWMPLWPPLFHYWCLEGAPASSPPPTEMPSGTFAPLGIQAQTTIRLQWKENCPTLAGALPWYYSSSGLSRDCGKTCSLQGKSHFVLTHTDVVLPPNPEFTAGQLLQNSINQHLYHQIPGVFQVSYVWDGLPG